MNIEEYTYNSNLGFYSICSNCMNNKIRKSLNMPSIEEEQIKRWKNEK